MAAVLERMETDAELYRSLWMNVLKQTIKEALEFEEDAMRWFLSPPEDDMIIVCSLANQDGEYVRSRIATWLLAHAQMILDKGKLGAYDRLRQQFYWDLPTSINIRAAMVFTRQYSNKAILFAPRFAPSLASSIVERGIISMHQRANSPDNLCLLD